MERVVSGCCRVEKAGCMGGSQQSRKISAKKGEIYAILEVGFSGVHGDACAAFEFSRI